MSIERFDLKGKICVITGALGRLGSGFCRALAGAGARVAATDLRTSEVPSIELPAGATGKMEYFPADVTDRGAVERTLDQVKRAWGIPHVLVNNAGIDSPPSAPVSETGPFENYPEDSWDRVMEVNLKGTFLCCQVFGGAMASERRGSIINIGSIYGLVSPDQGLYEFRRRKGEIFFKPVAYSASKSGILNLTRYLATYWGPCGVRVNTLTFGGVFDNQPTEFLEAYSRKVPLGRMAEPGEYDSAVIFLASEASSYMTGSNLVIDGGFTAW